MPRRMSCGDGAHGPRVYDWVSVPMVDGLVRFARIMKSFAPKKLKEYVPQTYRKG